MTAYRLVIVESPYHANTQKMARRNVQYMLDITRDSIRRGEAPFLSHLMYTGALDDEDLLERQVGIDLGYAWWESAEAICFYCDLGWSLGMVNAKLRAQQHRMIIEERFIEKDRHQGSEP